MFEVGFTEIVLILGLALLVLGPEKLPKLAAQVGRWTGRARSMARQLRVQLDQEVNFQEQRATHGKGETPSAKPSPAAEPIPPVEPDIHMAAETAAAESVAPTPGGVPEPEPALKPSNE